MLLQYNVKKIVHFKKNVGYSYKISKIRDYNIKIYYDGP